MTQYALLILPSANRVYAGEAAGLTQAELALLNCTVLDGRLADIGTSKLGGVPYVTFQAARLGFSHRVDQAIMRDIVVARRPRRRS